MKKCFLMLSLPISFSILISTLSGCGANRPIQGSYNVAALNSTTPKNCNCKKNNNSNNSTSETPSSNITPSPSTTLSPSESPTSSVSSSPSESPTPLPSSSSSPNPSKDKDKKNLFSSLIEKFKNIFKKPNK